MPELPEVETICRDLRPGVVGRCVEGVSLGDPGVVRTPPVEEFVQGVVGRRIKGVERRGKYLIFALDSHQCLVIHLKMTGSLLLRSSFHPTDPYTRAAFSLEGGQELRFTDPRKLGNLWLVADAEAVVGGLGPEALDPSFTSGELARRLKGRSVPIKALLLDQTFLAGLGNIYADEALFEARIHPLRRANALSQGDAENLHQAIHQVLATALTHRGTTFSDYKDPSGAAGCNQPLVSHRAGQPCPRCSTPIVRLPVRGRGAYFCPSCQRD